MANCPHCGAPHPEGATYCAACGQSVAAAAGPRPARSMKAILVVAIAGGCLLLTLVVGGCVAALVIPNFLDALQKAKTKRTVAEMRAASTALESYRSETGSCPTGDAAAVAPLLAPHGYQGKLEDGWKRPLRYSCLTPGDGGCQSYELASGGRDGVFESEPGQYEQGAFAATEYDGDIVLSDGLFQRWPEGPGRSATSG